MTTEFAGITTNSSINLTDAFPLALPKKQTPHREETAKIKTANAMSFSHGSGLLFLKNSHIKLSFLVDSRGTLSIFAVLFFSGAIWSEAHWGK
jgi:hypothetical protein